MHHLPKVKDACSNQAGGTQEVAMMGHRQRLIDGDEHDAVTGWRRYLRWRPGERSAVKRRIRRRERHEAALKIRKDDV